MNLGWLASGETQEPGYTFGSLRLESDGTLLRGNSIIHLPPRELAALRLLLANAGRVVTPSQLKKTLWADVHVTADSVSKCLSSLRARLQPDECIQTIYKRGYRIAASVRILNAATAEALPRLAIMPFTTGLNVPEYLGSAIAEETTARISGNPSRRRVSVLPLARDSVFTLAQRGCTAHEAGKALHADLVLTGSLRALPSHFRLRAEMIRVSDGAQIWAEDLLVAQTRIAGLEAELVDRLVSRLGNGGLQLTAAAEILPEDDSDSARREAWALFQRGHYEWQTLERHRLQDGLQHLSRAVALDPSLTAAHVDLVNISVAEALYGFTAPAVAADQVRRTAAAVQQTLNGAEAILPALGWVRFHADYNLRGALDAFAASVHLPHDAWTTRARVMFALSRHRFDEAIEWLTVALGSDPWSPWLQARLAWAYHLAGETRTSIEQAERALAQFPEHEGVSVYGAVILAHSGDAEHAVKLAADLVKRSPYFDIATAVHAYALARAGREGEARATLERLHWLSRERFVLRSFTPAVCVALGDAEGAIAELRAAETDRCPWFFQMLADPRLQPLGTHPEFIRMNAALAAMERDAAQTRGDKN